MDARALPWAAALTTVLLIGCGASEAPAPTGPFVTVLVQGPPLHGANGINVGPDGYLYVASVSSSAVAVVDPESGAVVDFWGLEQGITGPDDLAFGPGGAMFWTDIATGRVGKRAPDGTTSVVASLGPGVNPITFSDDGLFVAQCFLGDDLYELDPDGVEEPRVIIDDLGPQCGLNGMDWGPDGSLYGPRWFRGEVARVDVDTGTVETVASGFQIPAAVKFDSQGRLHVLDAQADEVVRVDVASGEKHVVGRLGVGGDNLVFDAADRLFVASRHDGSVVEITGPTTIREVVPGGLNTPGGLAYVPSTEGAGRLFVADSLSLREYDAATGAEVVAAGRSDSDLGQVRSAHRHGEQLILSGATTVSLWDLHADRLVARFEGFDEAVDALAYGDDIVVSEYATGSVLRFHPGSPDDRTAIASGLVEPAGLAVHGTDLYVADRSGTLFQILDDGEALDVLRAVASGLAGPEGIAAAEDGTLYVVEEDAGRVTRVNPETGSTTPVADGLALRGLERHPIGEATSVAFLSGIAVGDNTLFVSAYPKNRLYRIEL